jgi:hypothetical protein
VAEDLVLKSFDELSPFGGSIGWRNEFHLELR